MNIKIAGVLLASGLAATLLAQQKPEQASLGGNVYARCRFRSGDRRPRVPAGFIVQPFAAVAKARIFAVGPDEHLLRQPTRPRAVGGAEGR